MLRKIVLNPNCIFLTSEDYIKINVKQVTIYCLKKYAKNIYTEVSDCPKAELAERLYKRLKNGIFIILTGSEIICGNSFLGLTLSWYKLNNRIIISDSELNIVKEQRVTLLKDRLASRLILGLPFYPYNTVSLWEGISKLSPFHILSIRDDVVEEILVKSKRDKILDYKQSVKDIRNALISEISSEIYKHDKISADLSGGVDSASLAYLINKITCDFELFHAESNEDSNSDTKWAESIAKSLYQNLHKLSSIEQSEKRFEIEERYVGNKIPASPLLWADTEGYVAELLKHINTKNTHIHFIGIGSDELFTPMVDTPWAIVRQESMLKSLSYIIRYSSVMRRNFWSCIRDFNDRKSYFTELNEDIDNAFIDKKKVRQREFSWNDNIVVPDFLTKEYKEKSYRYLHDQLRETPFPLSKNRSQNQMILSIIFQKQVFNQINQLLGDDIDWCAPFLNYDVINNALNLPEKYKINNTLTKPTLYEALKGIVPEKIFLRGVKGDYSTALFEGYKNACKRYSSRIEDFELVKLGIINKDKLKSELSMPTARQERIEFFIKVCSLERWLKQLNSFLKN